MTRFLDALIRQSICYMIQINVYLGDLTDALAKMHSRITPRAVILHSKLVFSLVGML